MAKGETSCLSPVFPVLDPWEHLPRSFEFCPEHIKAIRNANGYGGL